jgi:methionine-rich copper-binding protein CopC
LETVRTRHPLIAGAALALALGATAPALAHVELVASSPADGAVVAVAPPTLRLTFGGPLGRVSTVRVTGPKGTVRTTARIDRRNARVALVGLSSRPAGRYRVAWTVLGQDGHAITGEFSFRSRRAAA